MLKMANVDTLTEIQILLPSPGEIAAQIHTFLTVELSWSGVINSKQQQLWD
jgi:hypothetical protein